MFSKLTSSSTHDISPGLFYVGISFHCIHPSNYTSLIEINNLSFISTFIKSLLNKKNCGNRKNRFWKCWWLESITIYLKIYNIMTNTHFHEFSHITYYLPVIYPWNISVLFSVGAWPIQITSWLLKLLPYVPTKSIDLKKNT